jgi:hypothetical protein
LRVRCLRESVRRERRRRRRRVDHLDIGYIVTRMNRVTMMDDDAVQIVTDGLSLAVAILWLLGLLFLLVVFSRRGGAGRVHW